MDDVALILDRITKLEIELTRVEANRKEAVSEINRKAEATKKRLRGKMASLRKAAKAFMGGSRKKELLKEWGQKSIRLFSGVVGWRLSDVKIVIAKGSEAKVAKALLKMGLDLCVEKKTTYTFNRTVMKRFVDRIKGIEGISVTGGKRDVWYAKTDPGGEGKPDT